MKDYIGEEIELGDELYVMKPIEGVLNEENMYVCRGFFGDQVLVVDDKGLQNPYDPKRFVMSAAGRMFREVKDAAETTGTQVGTT